MNQSIIEHKANMYYVEFREDFLLLCKNCGYTKLTKDGKKGKASPYCKALILSILESWTNEKRGKGDGLFVYMTYQQWEDAMYGMFGRNAIIDSLDELKGEGLIAREPYKMFGRDTFQYLLNAAEINKRMRGLEDKSPDILHSHPFTSKCIDDATRLQVNATHVKVNEDAFTCNHNIESNLTSTQNTVLFASSSDDAHTPPLFEDENARNLGGVVQTSPNYPIASSSTKSTTRKKKEKVPEPDKTPEEVAHEEEIKARCRVLKAKIVEWRGYDLETKGAKINESRCIRTLVEKFDASTHEQIYRYLFTKHWKYSKPDNRYKIGAYEMLEEAGNVTQILKEQRGGLSVINGTGPTEPRKRNTVPSLEELKRSKVGI